MKKKNLILLILAVLCIGKLTLHGQESFDFEYNEIELSIFPKEPGVCPNSTTDVTCLETFESYKWEMIDPHPEFIILYGQTQELIYPGEYRLTVEKYINDKLCTEQLLFEVHDLQNAEGIENYFINNGFYAVPIFLNQEGLKNDDVSDTRMQCNMYGLTFSNEFDFLDLDDEAYISNIINDFKPFNNDDYDAVQVKSQNTCLCEVGIDDLEESFYSNPLAIWSHIYTDSETDSDGKLYLKGLIPFEGEVPKNEEHMDHLISIHDQIITDDQNNADPKEATLEHLRVIISNILMPNPTGGYYLDTQCELTGSDIDGNHLFTPGGQAVILPSNASSVIIENDLASFAFGSMLKFDTPNKSWQNYHREEYGMVSNGFFNPINAEFYEEFTTTITECNDCILEVTTIVQGCDNFSCNLESDQYTTEYFDPNGVKDGGFNYEISSCNSAWVFWPITRKASKALIYDLICAIKNGDGTFEYDNKFTNKVIFAKNVILSDVEYEIVGVTLPKQGNSISLLETPILNNNGIPLGFTNSFEISPDNEVRMNFFKLELDEESEEDSEALSKICKNVLKSAYTYTKWDVISNVIKNCLSYYNLSEKYKLIDYLDPPDKDNLLLMVNGYRILGFSPGEKWWKGGVEYPTKEPEEAINPCYDNFEDGDYWGEAGVNFAKRINNNVVYLDGHHSIVTSNHRLMVSDDITQTTFATSLATCPPIKFLCFNFICALNEAPNGEGFYVRYWSGREAGWLLWDKMVGGEINIALNEDKTQITGKIDVVAHSMGYAYSKGVMDVLQQYLAPGNTFGNYYIVAPENARAYTEEEFNTYSPEIQAEVVVDLSQFESVFQYGSDFTPNGDKKCKQDGVAPQDRVRGLPDDNSNNVFIPGSEEKNKNFVDAHLMKNYGWVFEIPFGIEGYIKPR